jgi:hypothetical protein
MRGQATRGRSDGAAHAMSGSVSVLPKLGLRNLYL